MIGSFAEYLNVREELIEALSRRDLEWQSIKLRYWNKFYANRSQHRFNRLGANHFYQVQNDLLIIDFIMDEWQDLLDIDLPMALFEIGIEKEIKKYKKMSTKRLVGVLNSTRRDNIMHMAVKRLLEDRPCLPTQKNERKARINAKRRANKGQRKTGYRARGRR